MLINEIKDIIKFTLSEKVKNLSLNSKQISLLWKIKESKSQGLLGEDILNKTVILKNEKRALSEIILDPKNLNLVEGYVAKQVRLKLKESKSSDKPEPLSEDEINGSLQSIKSYSKFSDKIYRPSSLKPIAENIEKLVEFAERYTTENTNDWFDAVTVNRHMKQLREYSKNFSKSANEVTKIQSRMETMYEEIGQILSRYYEIDEK